MKTTCMFKQPIPQSLGCCVRGSNREKKQAGHQEPWCQANGFELYAKTFGTSLKYFKQGRGIFRSNLHFIITGKTTQKRLGFELLQIMLQIYSLFSQNSLDRIGCSLGHQHFAQSSLLLQYALVPKYALNYIGQKPN